MGETDYDYGPPVTTEGETSTPASTTGDEVVIEGESPHTPPENTGTITVPGGSPNDDAVEAFDPHIDSLDPATAVVGSDVSVTVTGSHFTAESVAEANQSAVTTTYVSGSELTVTLVDPGAAATVGVTVRNPTAEQESNTADFTWTDEAGKDSE